uniref:Uncharacterized protein n=1 Tax=Corvus moneduloides TaxID=1196302 RepID=A0A8C3GZH0_CORMO
MLSSCRIPFSPTSPPTFLTQRLALKPTHIKADHCCGKEEFVVLFPTLSLVTHSVLLG